MSERLDLSLLCMFGLIALLIMAFAFWSVSQEPMCSMSVGITADMNIQSELMQNVKITNIAVTAPCGSELYQVYNNLLNGVKP